MNMEIFGPLLICSVAGISTVIGALIVFFLPLNKEKMNNIITYCLGFSLTIMIFISLLELIPKGFMILLINMRLFIVFSLILGCFVISRLFIRFIAKYIKNSNNLYRVGVLSMIVLIIHNLPEGIITFLGSIYDLKIGLRLSIGIILHNIPEGIIIALPIYYTNRRKSEALLKTFLAGLAEPIGAIIAYLFVFQNLNTNIIGLILVFVGTIMISLGIDKIYPEVKIRDNRKLFYLSVTSGGGLFILINTLIS